MKHESGTVYAVILRPSRRCSDPAGALKRLLKFALRRCDLTCVRLSNVGTDDDGRLSDRDIMLRTTDTNLPVESTHE